MSRARRAGLVVLAVAGLLAPNLAWAQQNTGEAVHPPVHYQPVGTVPPTPRPLPTVTVQPVAQTPQVATGQLCMKIGDVVGSISTETANRYTQLTNDFAQRLPQVSGQFDAVAAGLVTARAQADATRSADFAKIEAKATTTSAKQAVTVFEAAVTAAVAAHQAAVDAADSTFRQGVLAAITQRQAQLKTAAMVYKTAVSNAVAAAQASCVVGANPATVRATLQSALAAARANLQAAQQSADRVKPNLDPLKATRRAAVDAADATFRTAVAQALGGLKTALGAVATGTPTPAAD